ncbi:hypothetical protein AB0K51_08840 [Kitasatospora sp. NPDC049285]
MTFPRTSPGVERRARRDAARSHPHRLRPLPAVCAALLAVALLLWGCIGP